MNENEITRIVADALREAFHLNTVQFENEKIERATIGAVLYDVAYNLSQEVWPNRTEESPVMPEEWREAIRGR